MFRQRRVRRSVLMRTCVLLSIAAILAGCAIDRMPPSAASSPMVHSAAELGVAISIERGAYQGRPAISVTIVNNSRRPICTLVDTIRNPNSFAMSIQLRDSVGRAIRPLPSGLIVPPEPGFLRRDPGASVQGSYYIEGRFKLPEGNNRLPPQTQARAGFEYTHCEDLTRRRMRSGWQTI